MPMALTGKRLSTSRLICSGAARMCRAVGGSSSLSGMWQSARIRAKRAGASPTEATRFDRDGNSLSRAGSPFMLKSALSICGPKAGRDLSSLVGISVMDSG